MRAGQLKNKVEIQLASSTTDNYGETANKDIDWSTVAVRSVGIEPLSGREATAAKQINPMVTHTIRLRYYSGLSSQHRFKWGDRIFSIDSVLNVMEKNREQVCTCIERV